MRQGWVIGFFSFYILIWGIILMTTSVAIGSDNVLDIFNALFSIGQVTSAVSSSLNSRALLTGVAGFFTNFIGALALWFPVTDNPTVSRIWTGNLIWVYYFPVSEIALGMVFSIVSVLRGVSSN